MFRSVECLLLYRPPPPLYCPLSHTTPHSTPFFFFSRFSCLLQIATSKSTEAATASCSIHLLLRVARSSLSSLFTLSLRLCFCFYFCLRAATFVFWIPNEVMSSSLYKKQQQQQQQRQQQENNNNTTIQKSSRYYNKKSCKIKTKSEIKCLKTRSSSNNNNNMTWSRLVYTITQNNWICW